jgi:hypothetical protein
MATQTYTTGTVSVSDGGTVVTGIGTIWSGTNVKAGDTIYINNVLPGVDVSEVTDTTHLVIPAPWAGGNKVSVPYTIVQNFPSRVVGVEAAKDVSTLVAALNKDGFIWFVGSTETDPDPSRGDEGQYAEQPSTTKRWIKTGGLWVYLGMQAALFSRYDLISFDTDRPASGELLLKVYPPGVTFRAGLTDSRAGAEVAATASSVFSLTKNGTQFATLTFAAGSAAGVIACASDAVFTTGDVLRVIAPAARDVTLSGVSATFIGYR